MRKCGLHPNSVRDERFQRKSSVQGGVGVVGVVKGKFQVLRMRFRDVRGLWRRWGKYGAQQTARTCPSGLGMSRVAGGRKPSGREAES